MAEDDLPERKGDGTERRVYTLPASLLERLRAYQVSQNITSEAEAARRLLDTALQMRDTVIDILNTFETRLAEERDLRVLAAEILAKHVLVVTVKFDAKDVIFDLADGSQGRVERDGSLYTSHVGEETWRPYKRRRPQAPVKSSGPVWEPAGGDLDDEIPF